MYSSSLCFYDLLWMPETMIMRESYVEHTNKGDKGHKGPICMLHIELQQTADK